MTDQERLAHLEEIVVSLGNRIELKERLIEQLRMDVNGALTDLAVASLTPFPRVR